MTVDFNNALPHGATPLDPNELAGLKPKHIVLLSELNEYENLNIAKAMLWLKRQRKQDPLSLPFLIELHKRMFGDVWVWAGSFRQTDKNIGVAWYEIPQRTMTLLDDTRFWMAHGTYPIDESVARLHHRLVSIHPFPNGNGRHARLLCDAVLTKSGHDPFTWGSTTTTPSEARTRYIHALRAADQRDFAPLLQIIRLA